jgi:hypothetical protein
MNSSREKENIHAQFKTNNQKTTEFKKFNKIIINNFKNLYVYLLFN